MGLLFKNIKLVDLNFKGFQPQQAFFVKKGVIQWIGPQNKVPKNIKIKKTVDLKNKLVLPSFIECHTHALYAGSRANEFEMRNQGVSYLDIAKKGGGILSTMKATRAASLKKITNITQERVNEFLKQGVSTLEIKTGYALDLENEIKCLEVLKKIKGPRVVSTFLGAHARPPEFSTNKDYLDYLIKNVLPVVKNRKLSNRVDIFIENNFFEKTESENYLQEAVRLGFDITVHANQLSLSAGADLAMKYRAKSADHMICLDERIVKSFSKSNTVAVLLPAADLYMKCAYPPARKLIDAGATVALATDYNPGSCPTQDLSLVGLLARLEMKMTLPEVFKAYTIGAAKALGVESVEGTLEVGKYANFICTEAELSDFFYSVGNMPEHKLYIHGKHIKI